MPIAKSDVVVGNCYKTNNNQQRRVICITDDKVIYESWGGNKGNFKQSKRPVTPPSLEKFANDVDKAIECPSGIRPLEDVQKECGCTSEESDNKEVDSTAQ